MGSVFGSPRPSDERVGGAYLGKQNQSNPTTVRKAQEVAEFWAGVSKGNGLGFLCVLARALGGLSLRGGQGLGSRAY